MLLLLAGVLPLVTSGAIAILVARDAATAAVLEGNRQVARRTAREIGGVIDAARDLLRAAADNRVRVELSPEQEHRMLVSFKRQFRALASLTRVAADGAPLAWSDAERPAAAATGDPGLQAALRDEIYAGAVSTGDELVPRMRVVLPVHEEGRPTGALIATLDLVAMWRIVDEIQVGASGRVLLLGPGGEVLAHGANRGKAMVVRGERLPDLAAAARGAADHGALFEGTGSLGQRALSVAVPVPSTPWVLVLEQDSAEAFAGVRRLSWMIGALVVAAVLLVVLGGLRLARRRVLEPVLALERAAAELGRENFEHRVRLDTGDELERLGAAMNDMAARVAAARDELRRAEHARALGLLAGGLAHDLKHPVATFQSLLMRAGRLSPEELDRRLAEAARRETPRLAALVEQLNDVGRAPARRDTEFPAAALAEVAEAFRGRAEERGLSLTVAAPGAGVRVRADKHMLSRALENLLANALEASPAGGALGVTIAARDAELELAVADQGAGIPASARELLFRGLASTKEGGLGLGLTVVRRVAEAHGGRILVEQPETGGSVFRLIIPLAPV